MTGVASRFVTRFRDYTYNDDVTHFANIHTHTSIRAPEWTCPAKDIDKDECRIYRMPLVCSVTFPAGSTEQGELN